MKDDGRATNLHLLLLSLLIEVGDLLFNPFSR